MLGMSARQALIAQLRIDEPVNNHKTVRRYLQEKNMRGEVSKNALVPSADNLFSVHTIPCAVVILYSQCFENTAYLLESSTFVDPKSNDWLLCLNHLRQALFHLLIVMIVVSTLCR